MIILVYIYIVYASFSAIVATSIIILSIKMHYLVAYRKLVGMFCIRLCETLLN